jgi:hypothetical protein
MAAEMDVNKLMLCLALVLLVAWIAGATPRTIRSTTCVASAMVLTEGIV